eukprot:TRINITY_DN75725_c0_g1_i1.p1 TRINITY_DN75725_c0_g1~~TRINITY_DN75725_c0_g1_i1.p1  ORF type:complete len:427 (+),score=61.98 TRINITY_DN75725_c0_g1_i1:105-1283(+)
MLVDGSGNVATEELVEVPQCRVVLIGPADLGPERIVQFAEGTLRILRLVPEGEADTHPRFVIAVSDSDASDGGTLCTISSGFLYPLLPETPVCVAEGTGLMFPDPESTNSYGVLFDAGGLELVIAQLESCGCSMKQHGEFVAATEAASGRPAQDSSQHGAMAHKTVAAMNEVSAVATSAIKLATGALSWGIRAATDSAKASPLMEPTSKPVPVPEVAKKGVHASRVVSMGVVSVSGAAMNAVAGVAGAMAGGVSSAGKAMGGGTSSSGWAADAKFVGVTAVGAGVSIFVALNDAADVLVKESLGSSAELVGHKFGDEAGKVTREGFHVVGNLMDAKSLLSAKAVAKSVGKKSAVAAATSAAAVWTADGGDGCAEIAPASGPSGGIRLGPKSS